jgi:hypothetical protein
MSLRIPAHLAALTLAMTALTMTALTMAALAQSVLAQSAVREPPELPSFVPAGVAATARGVPKPADVAPPVVVTQSPGAQPQVPAPVPVPVPVPDRPDPAVAAPPPPPPASSVQRQAPADEDPPETLVTPLKPAGEARPGRGRPRPESATVTAAGTAVQPVNPLCARLQFSETQFSRETATNAARTRLDDEAVATSKLRGWASYRKLGETATCDVALDLGFLGAQYKCLVAATFCSGNAVPAAGRASGRASRRTSKAAAP